MTDSTTHSNLICYYNSYKMSSTGDRIHFIFYPFQALRHCGNLLAGFFVDIYLGILQRYQDQILFGAGLWTKSWTVKEKSVYI